jgi:hypothetical protein
MTPGDFDILENPDRKLADASTWVFSEQDKIDFDYWTHRLSGLASPSGEGRRRDIALTTGSLGPHSVRAIRSIAEFVKPNSIFEIGFNCGISTMMWLHLCPKAKIVSVDISGADHTYRGVAQVAAWHRDRHQFINSDSKFCGPLLPTREFDLAFVDGDHEYDGVRADLGLCLDLKIPWVALDDYWPIFGPGVRRAVESMPQFARQWNQGNYALYRNLEVLPEDPSFTNKDGKLDWKRPAKKEERRNGFDAQPAKGGDKKEVGRA